MTVPSRNSVLAAATLLVAAGALFFWESIKSPADKPPGHTSIPQPISAAPAKLAPRLPSARAPGALRVLPSPVASPHTLGSAAEAEWVAARISAVRDLAWFDDAESLDKILAELRNPIPTIRTAALAATQAFGSRDAIPHLAAQAATTGDPLEAQQLQAVIDHLKLPTVVEQLAELPPE